MGIIYISRRVYLQWVKILALTTLIAGCSDTNKTTAFAGIGAAGAAAVCSLLTEGETRIWSGLACGVGGALVGGLIGQYLDDQEKQQLADATIQTAKTGKPQEVVNQESGTKITTEPVAPPKTAPAPPPTTEARLDRQCQTVRQTIVLKNGTSHEEDISVCKGPNGWEAA